MNTYSPVMKAACLLGLVAGIYGCSREMELVPDNDVAVNRSVEQAQRFFESTVGSPSLPDIYQKTNGDSSTTRTEALSLLNGSLEPDWSSARTWENDRVTGVELLALMTRPVHYSVRIENMEEVVSLTYQVPHVRIMINERKETKESYCFLATFLPDESYAGDLSRLGANPKGSDYWGITIYSYPDGTPAYGYRYENGEIKGTLRFDTSYEDRADPNLRIFMGIDHTAVTRDFGLIVIDPIIVTPDRPMMMTMTTIRTSRHRILTAVLAAVAAETVVAAEVAAIAQTRLTQPPIPKSRSRSPMVIV